MLFMWIEVGCYHCDESNFMDNGGVDDMTVPDVEGFTCWNCQKKNNLCKSGVTTESTIAYEDGLSCPCKAKEGFKEADNGEAEFPKTPQDS